MKTIVIQPHIPSWRKAARQLLNEQIPPQDIQWIMEGSQDLVFTFQDNLSHQEANPHHLSAAKIFRISKEFMALAETVAWHRSDTQWSLLYDVLWRMTHGGDKALLKNRTDKAVRILFQMSSAIRRDIHKMRAFVRFRLITEATRPDGVESYVSWFEPEHRIVKPSADFFKKRFANMQWSILTPDDCVHWNTEKLRFSAGVNKSVMPVDDDALEDLWRTYYKNIFNPARVKIKAMCSEMPKKYWKNLPEAETIEALIDSSHGKVTQMMEKIESPVKPTKKNDYLETIRNKNKEEC